MEIIGAFFLGALATWLVPRLLHHKHNHRRESLDAAIAEIALIQPASGLFQPEHILPLIADASSRRLRLFERVFEPLKRLVVQLGPFETPCSFLDVGTNGDTAVLALLDVQWTGYNPEDDWLEKGEKAFERVYEVATLLAGASGIEWNARRHLHLVRDEFPIPGTRRKTFDYTFCRFAVHHISSRGGARQKIVQEIWASTGKRMLLGDFVCSPGDGDDGEHHGGDGHHGQYGEHPGHHGEHPGHHGEHPGHHGDNRGQHETLAHERDGHESTEGSDDSGAAHGVVEHHTRSEHYVDLTVPKFLALLEKLGPSPANVKLMGYEGEDLSALAALPPEAFDLGTSYETVVIARLDREQG